MTMQPSPIFSEAQNAVLQGQYERVLEMLPLPSTPDWARIFWTGEAVPVKALRPPWHLYNDRLMDIYITLFRSIAETRLGLGTDDHNITEHLYNATRYWHINEVNAVFDLGLAINDIKTPDSFLMWEDFCTHLPSLAIGTLIWPPKDAPGIVHTDHPEIFQILFFEAALTLLKIKKDTIAKTLVGNMSQDQREIVEVLIQLSVSQKSLTEQHERIIKKWETHQGVRGLLFERRRQKPLLRISVLEGRITLDGTPKKINKYASYSSAIFMAFLSINKEVPLSAQDIVESALPGKSLRTIRGIVMQARQTFHAEFIKNVASHGYQLDHDYETITDLEELEVKVESQPDQTLQIIDKYLSIEILESPFIVHSISNILSQIEQIADHKRDGYITDRIGDIYKKYPELLNANKNRN
ncbi:hypothetical protein MF271_24410 (plasmid) [Deinococcus sp. KNUC1210]|uniref:hypothetical protein n=1 Tax=Deinococcus sp. KNUC1210 TaxID=2917691 RepID=UPI001EF03C97|nr:hypothetical protein [Deinococcus sp. KNUC1210]ULH18101.1 hypothetical protein MF271_24410 [Deinococcus sp. KNUC1210]